MNIKTREMLKMYYVNVHIANNWILKASII